MGQYESAFEEEWAEENLHNYWDDPDYDCEEDHKFDPDI